MTTLPDNAVGRRPIQLACPVVRDGKWVAKAIPSGRPLYRLPELRLDETVVVMEGEAAAGMAALCGINATSGGSKSPHRTDWTPLTGREVVVVAGNDHEGLKYAVSVFEKLLWFDCQCRFIETLPDVPPKGDFVDWCDVALGDAAEPEDFYQAFWTVVANQAVEIVPA